MTRHLFQGLLVLFVLCASLSFAKNKPKVYDHTGIVLPLGPDHADYHYSFSGERGTYNVDCNVDTSSVECHEGIALIMIKFDNDSEAAVDVLTRPEPDYKRPYEHDPIFKLWLNPDDASDKHFQYRLAESGVGSAKHPIICVSYDVFDKKGRRKGTDEACYFYLVRPA